MACDEPEKKTSEELFGVSEGRLREILAAKGVGRLLELEAARRRVLPEAERLAGAEEEERRRHEAAVKQIVADRKKLRASCPHPETRFHPDASGNNDSWHECLWCGADV